MEDKVDESEFEKIKYLFNDEDYRLFRGVISKRNNYKLTDSGISKLIVEVDRLRSCIASALPINSEDLDKIIYSLDFSDWATGEIKGIKGHFLLKSAIPKLIAEVERLTGIKNMAGVKTTEHKADTKKSDPEASNPRSNNNEKPLTSPGEIPNINITPFYKRLLKESQERLTEKLLNWFKQTEDKISN